MTARETPDPQLLLLEDLPSFTPHISRLVGMMNYARFTTLRTVRDLTTAQLDSLPDERGNSIGALLAHMAAVEVAYQAFTFEGRELTEDEEARWGAALELGERGRAELRGRDLAYYLNVLSEVRERTLAGFRERDDAWLAESRPFWWARGNHYFMWFHVFEDEINHRGQIRLLRARLPDNLD